jgi:beta-lactam-binding protein with PASTA domain
MSERVDRNELEMLRATIQLKDQTIVNLQTQVSDFKVSKERLEKDRGELLEKISGLERMNQELRNEIAALKLQRPSLKSENLISSFQKSIEKMQESVRTADSRVGYAISDLDISLKTNVSLDEEGEIRYQLPMVGEKATPDGVSTIRFSLRPVPKVEPSPPDTVEVPNLIGLEREQATQMVNEAGLALGTVIERRSSTTPGLVIMQSPESYARAPKGTKVDLVVSRVTVMKVPNLIGVDLENALELIRNLGLSLGEVIRRESVSKLGTVISQSITAGIQVSSGTKIDLIIAKPEETKVPNVLGKTLDEVKSVLDSAKLKTGRVAYEASRQPTNVVIKQSPEPNTAVPSGSAVDVTLSRGDYVQVPDLLGMDLREAERILSRTGLARGRVTEKSSIKREGTVIRQDPEPDAEVERGKSVDLEVATQKLEAVEGVGGRIGARLRRVNVNTLSDLINATAASLARALGEGNARNLVNKARLIAGTENLVDIVEKEALELMIIGGEVFTRISLAEADAKDLYGKLSKAVEEGLVKLPERYELTPEKVVSWIRSARG